MMRVIYTNFFCRVLRQKALVSLLFSLSLSWENLSLLFSLFRLSVRQKFIPLLSLKSSTQQKVLMRIFLFFLQKAQKEEQKKRKRRTRTHDLILIIISLIVTFFHLFSRRHTTNTNKNTPHYYYTTTPFTRLFAISHRERERKCVCV
jgi:Ni,Fe-hydrogenase I cytochrome b subunit